MPAVCDEVEPLYPGALDLGDEGEVIADFPFADGVVMLGRSGPPGETYFGVIECFTGGGEGFVGGGPGEAWQGCYRADYSDAGYAIVIVEDPSWTVEVQGEPAEVVPAGDVGAAFVEGSFYARPRVKLRDGEGDDSAC